jgi:hypothetical protein
LDDRSGAVVIATTCCVAAVRNGDLARFNEVLVQCGDKFQADGTYTLIVRLHHNVIKTAIRKISLSYSRISLEDVTAKLQLDSPEDAECILAKVSTRGLGQCLVLWVRSRSGLGLRSGCGAEIKQCKVK